jgi:hypothetical protein
VDALVKAAIPIGLVRSSVRASEFTLVLKSTWVLQHGGYARLAPFQEMLREPQREAGRLIYPTDFVEAKLACDVVLIGPVLMADGPFSLRVGGLQRTSPTPRALGPAVQLDRQWASSCAPADGRMPHPAFPLVVDLQGRDFRLGSSIPGPTPWVALIVEDRVDRPLLVTLRLDTVLVDPARAQVELVMRGVFSYSGAVDREVVAAVNPLGAPPTSTDELRSWTRVRLVEPSLRRPSPTARGDAPVLERKPSNTQRLVAQAPAPPAAPAPDSSDLDDAPTFSGDETFILGDASVDGVILEALKPEPTITLEAIDDDPPTIPPKRLAPVQAARVDVPPAASHAQAPPRAELPRSDTVTLDVPVVPLAVSTALMPAITPGLVSSAAMPFRPPGPWSAVGPRPAQAPETPSNQGLPALPSLASLVVAPETAEVTRPKLSTGVGPQWLSTQGPRSSRSPTTAGTPFGGRSDDLHTARPAFPFGLEPTAVDTTEQRSPVAASTDGATERRDEPARSVAPPAGLEPHKLAPLEPVAAPSALAGLAASLSRSAPPPPPVRPLASEPPPPAPIPMSLLRGVPSALGSEHVPGLPAPASPPSPSGFVEAPADHPRAEPVGPSSPLEAPDLVAGPGPAKKRLRPAPGSGPKIEGLTIEEYAFLRAALWADEANRRDILKENDLTELKWKVIERRWSKHIEALAERPAELSSLLEVLQRASAEQGSGAG